MAPSQSSLSERRVFWRQSAIVGAVLAALAAVLLWRAERLGAGFGHDVALNVGTGLVELVLAAVFLPPLISFVARLVAGEKPEKFEFEEFIARVERADTSVDIQKYWTNLLEIEYRERFLAAVRKALVGGATVRVLLVDPSCDDAVYRSSQVPETGRAGVTAVDLMRENLEVLADFARGLGSDVVRSRFHVKVSRSGPDWHIYRVDDHVSFGVFPKGARASEAKQLETRASSAVGDWLLDSFTTRWGASHSIGLSDHQSLKLSFVGGNTYTWRYVAVAEDIWVDVHALALGELRSPDYRVTLNEGAEKFFCLELSEDEEASKAFARKYGAALQPALFKLIEVSTSAQADAVA